MNTSKLGIVLLIATGFLIPPQAAIAEEPDAPQTNRYLGDRWNVRLFGNLSTLTSDVSAGRDLGALINLEDLLGFEDQMTTWSLDAFFRFTKNQRHTIRFSYADFSRDAYAAVHGTIPIFDVEFLGELDSSFGNQVGTFTYQYSFTNTKKTEAGISAGLGFYKYALAISGRYILDGDPSLSEFGSRAESVLAPVPTVGFFVNYAILPSLILDFRTSFIDLTIGVHEGRIFNNSANLTWYPSRHFGLGLGLAGSDVVYENTGSDSRIKVELRQTSLTLNASLVF